MGLDPEQRADFYASTGWGGASELPVGEDWSQRKIFRIKKKDKTAIVMHAVPDDDPRATPGHKLGDYIKIADYLRSLELSAPEVFAQNLKGGLLLVEDFGDDSFSRLLGMGEGRTHDLYLIATNALIHLHQQARSKPIELPNFYDGHVYKGRRRIVDWYMPFARGQRNAEGLVEDYERIWKGIEKNLPSIPHQFQHIDFHPGNLMWLPERDHVQQVGILDFQGAMNGPVPYDLVNLLEDARRIVSEPIRLECLERFLKSLAEDERDAFAQWYPVIACQFHSRVIGQAIKLALSGKTALLPLIPTLQRYMMRDLENETLKPLKDWFMRQNITFGENCDVNRNAAERLIRPDAF
ncbi:MAG: phosphotransferase [Pseudobdellovibrionaceae bacterium]